MRDLNFAPVRATAVLAAALAGLLCAAAPASADQTDPTNPLVGKRQYMDCAASHIGGALKYNPWHFARKYRKYETLIRKTAEVPQAKWFAGIRERPTRQVSSYLAGVDNPQWGGPGCATRLRGQRDAYVGEYPVVAIRRLVNGNCAGMRRQGARQYSAWIDAFIRAATRGTGRRDMTVILEPDAIGLMGARRSCLKRSEVPGRLRLLADAAQRLGRTPGLNVYIDAGSSSWLKRSTVIKYLRAGGVQYVRGFALGSTHFNTNRRELAFGDSVARALGNKNYVVNTAENANGSLPRSRWGRYGSRATTCNPPNAGLGTQPTTNTGSRFADAFLWISRPGLSSNGKKGNYNCGPDRGPTENVMWLDKLLYEARQASFKKANWPPLPL